VVDVRSNPMLRQQIQAIVAVGQQPASTPTPAAQPVPTPVSPLLTPPEPSIAQRLQELETLRATGAIIETEYTTKRQQMIA
jgi:hypothetical protein